MHFERLHGIKKIRTRALAVPPYIIGHCQHCFLINIFYLTLTKSTDNKIFHSSPRVFKDEEHNTGGGSRAEQGWSQARVQGSDTLCLIIIIMFCDDDDFDGGQGYCYNQNNENVDDGMAINSRDSRIVQQMIVQL